MRVELWSKRASRRAPASAAGAGETTSRTPLAAGGRGSTGGRAGGVGPKAVKPHEHTPQHRLRRVARKRCAACVQVRVMLRYVLGARTSRPATPLRALLM